MKTSILKSRRPVPKGKQIGLRSKPGKKSAWDRLPFVGKDHGRLASDWDLPMTGGYFGGIEAGKVVARLYLKYLRDERDNPCRLGSSCLQGMLIGLETKAPATKDEDASLRGQRVGFISEIAAWLEAAATRLGSGFDAIPERSFVQQANEALDQTDAVFFASIEAGVSQ